MDWNYFSPYIRLALNSYVSPPFSIVNRVIFDYELLYVKEGEIQVIIGSKTYKGVKGDIFFFRPREPHTIHFISKPYVHQPHVHFDLFYDHNSPNIPVSLKPIDMFTEEEKEKIREDVTKTLPYHIPTYIKLVKPINFEKLLMEIISEYEKKLPYYDLQLKSLFTQLWTYLLREIYWLNNPKTYSIINTIIEVRKYLSLNTSSEVTLDELSKLFNINKYYLVKLFNKNFNESPIHFHIRKRIDVAKELLQFTNFSITEIAEKTGFKSIHTFSRTFKQLEEVSPNKFRNIRHM